MCKALLYLFSHRFRYGGRKCVSNHPAGNCFPATECPCIRKSLNPGHHPAGKPRHSLKTGSGCGIRNTPSINTQFSPCLPGSGRAKVRPTMLLRTAHQRWSDTIRLLCPPFCPSPFVFCHQIIQRFANCSGTVWLVLWIGKSPILIFSYADNDNSWAKLGNTKV